MPDPIDEDAPLVAVVAADAVDLLTAATDAQVGYPGLRSVRDVEAVLSALARLIDELHDTAGHLDDYLSDQLDQDRLAPAAAVPRAPGEVARVVGDALLEVRQLAAQLSTAITAAELAALQLTSR